MNGSFPHVSLLEKFKLRLLVDAHNSMSQPKPFMALAHADTRVADAQYTLRELAEDDTNRDALLISFPLQRLPTADMGNALAQAALDLSENKPADWQLLLTGCAATWAVDQTLKADSQQRYHYMYDTVTSSAHLMPADLSYIPAVHYGVVAGQFYQTLCQKMNRMQTRSARDELQNPTHETIGFCDDGTAAYRKHKGFLLAFLDENETDMILPRIHVPPTPAKQLNLFTKIFRTG